MNPLSFLYYHFLFRPLFNILFSFYYFFPIKDLGIAVIFLTLLVRILFHPLMRKNIESQKKLAEIQTKISQTKREYQSKDEQVKALFSILKKEKLNPFSSFLVLLIQLPLLIALFQVFKTGIQSQNFQHLYAFLPAPKKINFLFLNFIDLTKPNLSLAFLVAILQFFQGKETFKTSTQKSPFGKIMEKQLSFLFPFFTFFILTGLPSVISLYFLSSLIFSLIENKLIFKKFYAQSK